MQLVLLDIAKVCDKMFNLKLPFTHGIEMELQLVKNNGRWIDGTLMPNIMKELVYSAKEYLINIIKTDAPDEVKKKTVGFEIKEIKETGRNKGLVVVLKYKVKEKIEEFEIIGRDAHGSGVTWILEIVTPPCEYLEELEWWTHMLLKVCHKIIKGMPGLMLISTGLNPMEKFSVGISFGDHHHIGIEDENLRKAVYNMIRNFIPHLIALSVNSPLMDSKIPEITVTPANSITLSSQIDPFSIRLKENQRQLGPNDERRYIPYLTKEKGLDYFREVVQYATNYDARFVDMFPFTRFGTIEIRFFDSQLTPQDRIGYALIIEALALKAKEMYEKNIRIPDVSSETLVKNRERAIMKGPMIGFFRDKNLPQDAFRKIYQEEKVYDGEKRLQYIHESCINLLYYIKDELFRLGAGEKPYLNSMLIELFGGRKKVLTPPITPAQYQLYVLKHVCKGNYQQFVRIFEAITEKAVVNPNYNPLVEEFGAPNIPEFLVPVGFDIELDIPKVYAGEVATLSVIVKSVGEDAIDSALNYFASNEDGKLVLSENIHIGKMRRGDRKIFKVELKTDRNISNYTFHAEFYDKGKKRLEASRTISPYIIDGSIVHLGPDVYTSLKPTDSIPFLVQLRNNFPFDVAGEIFIDLVDIRSGETIYGVSKKLNINSRAKEVYTPKVIEGVEIEKLLSGEEKIPEVLETYAGILKGQRYTPLGTIHFPVEKFEKQAKRCKFLLKLIDIDEKELVRAESKQFLVRVLQIPKTLTEFKAVEEKKIEVLEAKKEVLEKFVIGIRSKPYIGPDEEIRMEDGKVIEFSVMVLWKITGEKDFLIDAEILDESNERVYNTREKIKLLGGRGMSSQYRWIPTLKKDKEKYSLKIKVSCDERREEKTYEFYLVKLKKNENI
ncbi:MAG: hypothetical protein AB1779_02140 [Candidatus Thermoplasmatota archaeon]